MKWFTTPKGKLVRSIELRPVTCFITPKGEVIKNSELTKVKLPPVPDAEQLKAIGYMLSEPQPRVPVHNVDMWWNHRVCSADNAVVNFSWYHGLRWIVEEIPELKDMPVHPDCPRSCIDVLEPPMPVAPDGYEFRRVKPDTDSTRNPLRVCNSEGSGSFRCLLSAALDDSDFAGRFDEFGKYMPHDPMWRGRSHPHLWDNFDEDYTRVRPSFVMYKKS